MTTAPMPAEGEFATHRPLLFSVAYQILGSVAEAERAVQAGLDSWNVAGSDLVEDPRTHLVQVVARESVGLLKVRAEEREEQVGPWLPEPLPTGPGVQGGPFDHVLDGEMVTMPMLLVLEHLTPSQRAVFVLRDVFGFSYTMIAAALDSTEGAVRKVLQRARLQVIKRTRPGIATSKEARFVAERFVRAAAAGDSRGLMDVMAPAVVFISDEGPGVASAGYRAVRGRDRVSRLVAGTLARSGSRGRLQLRPASFNGMPSMILLLDGAVECVVTLEVREGCVAALYCVRDPAKLTAVLV